MKTKEEIVEILNVIGLDPERWEYSKIKQFLIDDLDKLPERDEFNLTNDGKYYYDNHKKIEEVLFGCTYEVIQDKRNDEYWEWVVKFNHPEGVFYLHQYDYYSSQMGLVGNLSEISFVIPVQKTIIDYVQV